LASSLLIRSLLEEKAAQETGGEQKKARLSYLNVLPKHSASTPTLYFPDKSVEFINEGREFASFTNRGPGSYNQNQRGENLFSQSKRRKLTNMENVIQSLKTGTLVLLFGTMLMACAEKPIQGTDSALQALQTAKQAGAEKYAPESLRVAEDEYQKAQEEIAAQDDAFVMTRNYDGANALLVKVVADAEKAKTEAIANRQLFKTEAEGAVVLAKTSLEEAKNLLAQAPTGKGTQADLQALRGDLQAAETTFAEIEAIMAMEDYIGVKAKAESVQALAARVNEQVAQAIQKTGKHKKA
jgi:hypothetical protein